MTQTNARRVTMQDIARESGYSVNTVSHALRNKDDISRETRDRIQTIAREMGYTGNQIASSLRSGRTHMFAVILGGMSNPFYGIMADAIQDAAQEAGYPVMIMCSRDDAALEAQLVEQAIARMVDGILLFPTSRSAPTIARLRASGMPFVLMSRTLADCEADCVVCDEMHGAYLATEHLIRAGRRKLAYIASGDVVYSGQQRLEGFMLACDDAGIPESDRRIFSGERNIMNRQQVVPWFTNLAEQLDELQHAGFDGLFVFCDAEAWQALEVIQKSGRFRPDSFGIVGFDNIEGALAFPMPLCSVGYDFAEMARQGVERLRARIHGDNQPFQTVTCPVHLVCRGSCQAKK